MNLLTSILNLFRKKDNPWNNPDIVPAFVSGGVQYYTIDFPKLPTLRAIHARHIYEAMAMKCDAEYLEKWCEAALNVLNDWSGKGKNFNDIYSLVEQLSSRLKWAYEPGIVRKLASVIYFDKSEDPRQYDVTYNLKKIAKWEKDNDITAFFLSEPITKLVPFLADYQHDIKDYSETIKLLNETHWASILSLLSESQKKTLSISPSLLSGVETRTN